MATSAQAPDHLAALITLGTAVLPVISALAGVALGGWLENRREKSRREYEQSVRFHDERLNAYSKYWRALASFTASASVWINNGGVGQLMGSELVSPTLGPYNESTSRARLLASAAVREHLDAIHACMMNLTDEPAVETVRANIDETILHRARLETAMRAELGIK